MTAPLYGLIFEPLPSLHELSEHMGDMLDDEAEEKRARWTFNIVVFLLLFPFAIDLSYMTYSVIPIGVGVSLIAWRVWRTPGITNPMSSHVGSRLRKFLRNLGIALGPALILLGVSIFATTNRFSKSPIGFPFSITYPIPGCATPGFPSLCLAYDPVLVALNYLFWVGLSFALLTLASWVRTRGAKLHSTEQLPKNPQREEMTDRLNASKTL